MSEEPTAKLESNKTADVVREASPTSNLAGRKVREGSWLPVLGSAMFVAVLLGLIALAALNG